MQPSAQDPSQVPDEHEDARNATDAALGSPGLPDELRRHQKKYAMFAVLPVVIGLVAFGFAMNAALRESRAGVALNQANRSKIEDLSKALEIEKEQTASLTRRITADETLAKILPPFIPTNPSVAIRSDSDAVQLMATITGVSAELPDLEKMKQAPLDCEGCTAFNAVLLVFDRMRENLKPGFNELKPIEMYRAVKESAHFYRPELDSLRTGDVVLVTLALEHTTRTIIAKDVHSSGQESMLFVVRLSESNALLYGYTPAGLSVTEFKPTTMMKVFTAFNDEFARDTSESSPLALHGEESR